MPLYAYDCGDCGPFDLHRPLGEGGETGRCPACGAEGRRVFSPPALARLARPLRRALDSEERSAHEPAVVTAKQGAPMPHVHRGHGCCSA